MSRSTTMIQPSLLPLMQQLDATVGCRRQYRIRPSCCNTGSGQSCSTSSSHHDTQQGSDLCHPKQSSHLLPSRNGNSGTFSTTLLPQNTSTDMMATASSSTNMAAAAAPPSPAPTSEPAQPAFLANLPIRSDGLGLSSFDHDTLERYLTPVAEALKAMDAETVLDLERTEKGAKLRDDINVKPIHGEINPPQVKYEGDGSSIVRYLHLSEVEGKYSIGIFVFPPYATIPLHDHPGMCVLSRVLYGDLHRLSLDLVPEAPESSPSKRNSWFSQMVSPLRQHRQQLPEGSKRALKNGVDYLQAPDVTVLYPYEGNLHEFVAGPNGAAVLDVLLPPYDVDQNRDCTFYNICDDFEEEEQDESGDYYNKLPQAKSRACWIIPTNQPEDFHCLSGSYGNIGVDDSDSDVY